MKALICIFLLLLPSGVLAQNLALGTPASGVLTNTTGLPAAGVVGTAAILGANTFTGQQIISLNGAASTPPVTLTGTIFTGGSATTTKPAFLIEPTGATSTGWSTSGTLAGFNSPSGFAGNILDVQANGASRFKVGTSVTTIATGVDVPLVFTAGNATLTIQNQGGGQPGVFVVSMAIGTYTHLSGSQGALKIAPTYNQASGTAANTDLLINRTETAVGSGAQLLADFQVGGTSKFSVSNTGSVVATGLATATGTPDSLCINTSTVVRNAALTCTVSSENVKNHLSPIPGTMQDFMGLRPLQFEYNDKPGRTRWGFGAQQVASVNPALADGWRADGQPWSLDQNAILALTVKAVQELTAEVEILKRK